MGKGIGFRNPALSFFNLSYARVVQGEPAKVKHTQGRGNS